MTANQLKYWEIRWRQYYENQSLKETKRSNLVKEAETERSNRVKEAETRRHNLVEERIAKQELVIKRIQLSHTQEQINQKWADLDRQERALFINTTLENYRLMQKDKEIDLKAKEVQLKADKLLSDVTLAIADLVTEYTQTEEKINIDRFDSYVNALGKGWTKAGVASFMRDLDQDSKTPENLKSLLSNIAKKYDLDVEINGPNSATSKTVDAVKQHMESTKNDPHPYIREDGSTRDRKSVV